MDLGLKGKSAVVIGASRGIGREIAHRFAEEGAQVGFCARGEEALRDAAATLRRTGARVHAESCDVGQHEALRGFLESARKALGGVDVLVNNASGFGFSDDEAGWQTSINVDLMAAVRATQIVTPWMAAAGGGVIIHIASISGLEAGSPPAYAAVKAALISHSKTLAVSLAAKKIRVNVVAPGSIEFPGGGWDRMRQNDRPFYDSVLARIPWGRMGTVDEVADAVVFLASSRASWITGACLTVDGGQHKGNL
ncbi:MAG TPA: SDR family NAD(P)-dependent oxidoreductase [Vicinamibacterales bacterium]|nr:SDR family NAD(P)-dependent oxidoreductase [Vicinamibacterales bacterium]